MAARSFFGAAASALLLVSAEARGDEASAPPSSRFDARGNVLISAERILPFATVSDDSGDDQSTAQIGWGPLVAPHSIHEVPRLAIDVAVVDRLTLGAAPIFTVHPGTPARAALGIAPRVGYVLTLSEHVHLWPHGGPAYAWVDGYLSGSQLMVSAEIPFVFELAEHAAVSLGVSGGTALTNEPAGERETNTRSSYAGINGGLVAWF